MKAHESCSSIQSSNFDDFTASLSPPLRIASMRDMVLVVLFRGRGDVWNLMEGTEQRSVQFNSKLPLRWLAGGRARRELTREPWRERSRFFFLHVCV